MELSVKSNATTREYSLILVNTLILSTCKAKYFKREHYMNSTEYFSVGNIAMHITRMLLLYPLVTNLSCCLHCASFFQIQRLRVYIIENETLQV